MQKSCPFKLRADLGVMQLKRICLMTMLVGMNLGSYILIASDRRETNMLNGKVVKVISDNVDKLIEWNGMVDTLLGQD